MNSVGRDNSDVVVILITKVLAIDPSYIYTSFIVTIDRFTVEL